MRETDQDARVCVESETSGRRASVVPVSAHARVKARERLLVRDASAAATLDSYLADALQDKRGRLVIPSRRHSLRDRDTTARGFAETSTGEAEREETERPESPLSRFLRATRRNGGLPTVVRGDHTAGARELLSQRCEGLGDILRSRRLGFLSRPAGSMEKLLREKIDEAKSLRYRSDRQLGQENFQPNLADNVSSQSSHRLGAELLNAPDVAAKAPIPHAKPVRPQVMVSTASNDLITTQETASTDTIVPIRNGAEISTTLAARRIQRLWRRWLQIQRIKPQTGLLEDPPVSVKDFTQDLIEESCSEAADGSVVDSSSCVEDPTDEVSKAIDGVSLRDHLAQVYVSDESTKIPMWQDDDWSILEEGRYSTSSLLDLSDAVEPNLSTLVREKPHVVVEMQEAKRQEQVRAQRSSRRATRKEGPEPSKHQKRSRALKQLAIRSRLVLLPSSKRLVRLTISLRPGSRQRKPNRLRLKVATRHRLLSSDTRDDDSTRELHRTADDTASELISPEAIETLQMQLSRYVEYSNLEATTGCDLSTSGVAAVKSVPSEISEGALFQDQQFMGVDNVASDIDRGDSVQDANLESSMSSFVDEELMAQSSIGGGFPLPDATSLDASEAGGHPFNRATVFHGTELLFPALREVELEVQRTLVRIQAQHTRDQQALIDAYANDAYFSTFLSPPKPAEPRAQLPSSSPRESPASPNQQEFLEALDAFKQSLRASRCASPVVEAEETSDPSLPDDESSSSVGDVDAELEAMLDEIRRCKRQIAAARRA